MLAHNNLKIMKRYIYKIGFLVIGMGMPVLAKAPSPASPQTPASSVLGSKGARSTFVASPQAATPAKVAKQPTRKESFLVVTPSLARPSVSYTLFSKMAATVAQRSPAADSSLLPTAPNLGETISGGRLARVTAYWAGEGDYYTGKCISATGVRLHEGHCAVDPNTIPYGSVVEIAGLGKYLAVDTGSAVISRTAAREAGRTAAERGALVVDLFFEDRSEGERFAASAAKFVSISWWTPSSTGSQAKAARSLFADENWTKIQSKQL